MKKLGILTIGQSPRPDILQDLMPVFGENTALIEAGALDGLSEEEIKKLSPGEEERMLVTRLSDGTEVHVAEEKLTACMQQKIYEMETAGVDCILLLCTAAFHGLRCGVPLIEPRKILNRLVPLKSKDSSIGVLSPEAEQVEATKKDWHGIINHLEVLTASPYGSMKEIERAAEQFSSMNIDFVVLDCMGYTEAIRRQIEEISGKTVILSKTLAAHRVMEILEEQQ